MSSWKLYQAVRACSAAATGAVRSLRHNPGVVAVPFEYTEVGIATLGQVASAESLRPLVVTTGGFLKLIEWALETGLVLRDLEFTDELLSEDAQEIERAVLSLRDGGSLQPLKALLTDLTRRESIVVRKATFWIEGDYDGGRIRFSIYNNGILSSTGGEETLEAADLALSMLGHAAVGRMTP
ncbi:MAG: hypothetical protein ACM3XM_13180 [Mycobacterium leprae]